MLYSRILVRSSALIVLIYILYSCANNSPREFYVDVVKGNDQNNGAINYPFLTIDKALSTVAERVKQGIVSDKIYLREGVYRKESVQTLYQLELKGTSEDYALLSAMPCDSTYHNAVKRKSGQWYEKVVFDDAQIISSQWTRSEVNEDIRQTNPGFVHLEWTHQNLWPWRSHGLPVTDKDSTPETTEFTVAPYMLLQNGKPSVWVNSLNDLQEGGQHFYDHFSKTLYLIPIDGKDPNQCKIETWYGGEEDFEVGTLHLDGEGRALFDGNLQYAAIKGFEFRMFNKLFELHRRKYHHESERVIQQDVLFEDNFCQYGWIQILLDANTIFDSIPGVSLPRYDDRARWMVRNNVFYRPSREVCQLHGNDHIFEDNVIIDHLGPWAGPAACVSAVNTRNTRNFLAKGNYFVGQGNNQFHGGSVFMIESGSEHADENGDYLFGGQTYENNLIANVTSGAAFVLGKGGARLKNITLKGNIVKTNKNSPAILMGSPHQNLTISGNIFYDQQGIIKIRNMSKEVNFNSLPSSINISQNMFVNNHTLFDQKFLNSQAENTIEINRNLYFENNGTPEGENVVEIDPRYTDPENFDFTNQVRKVDSLFFGTMMKKVFWMDYRRTYSYEESQTYFKKQIEIMK